MPKSPVLAIPTLRWPPAAGGLRVMGRHPPDAARLTLALRLDERIGTSAQIDQICVCRAPISCTGSAAPNGGSGAAVARSAVTFSEPADCLRAALTSLAVSSIGHREATHTWAAATRR